MSDRRYLLSITELWEGTPRLSAEQLVELACTKLDSERLRKVQKAGSKRKQAECIGAGLLLQLGLQERKAYGKQPIPEGEVLSASFCKAFQSLTVSRVLAGLDTPVEPEYTYSEKGKPYFKKNPLYFNLSHSGEYVFCTFSEQEVGVDIQYRKPGDRERMVNRFFTESERNAWEACAKQEREQFFYKLWTRKEAYGKLTGEGITASMAVDVMTAPGVFWEDYELPDHYQISICKYAGEKE